MGEKGRDEASGEAHHRHTTGPAVRPGLNYQSPPPLHGSSRDADWEQTTRNRRNKLHLMNIDDALRYSNANASPTPYDFQETAARPPPDCQTPVIAGGLEKYLPTNSDRPPELTALHSALLMLP